MKILKIDIDDFLAFCNDRADETVNFDSASNCALAQYYKSKYPNMSVMARFHSVKIGDMYVPLRQNFLELYPDMDCKEEIDHNQIVGDAVASFVTWDETYGTFGELAEAIMEHQ